MAQLQYYNPRELSGETLEQLLIGHDEVLGEILDDLARKVDTPSRRHWLIRGPHGIGKTHLAAVICRRVLRDLSAGYLPIWLGETSAYELDSAAALPLRIAERLRVELAGDPDLPAFERRLDEIHRRADHRKIPVEQLNSLLASEARRLDRTLLVVVENLDRLLAAPGPGGGRPRGAGWLPTSPEILLLATMSTRQRAVSGRFRERTLGPLTEPQTHTLFARLATCTGQAERAGLLGSAGDGPLRLRLLHRLTGGNARSIVMAFPLISQVAGIDGMAEVIVGLLDQKTGTYEAQLARLGHRERVVLTALCHAAENLPAEDLAREAGLDQRSLAIPLATLVGEGLVEPIGSKGHVRYEVSDPLLRLWFRYRDRTAPIGPILRFLAVPPPAAAPYSPGGRPAEASLTDPLTLHPGMPRAAGAAGSLRLTAGAAEPPESGPAAIAIDLDSSTARPAPCRIDPLGELVDLPTDLRAEHAATGASASNAAALVDLGVRLGQHGRLDEAVRVYRHVIARHDPAAAPAIAPQAARARVHLGVTLARLGRNGDAALAFRDVLSRFGEQRHPAVELEVARALVHLGVMLRREGRAREAVISHRHAISRFGPAAWPALQVQVAQAFVNLGVALTELGQVDDAIGAYEDAVARFGAAPETKIQVAVAQALLNLARAQIQAGRKEQGIRALREVNARFGESSAPPLQERVARALAHLGETLASGGRSDEATSVFRYLDTRLSCLPSPAVREEVARGLLALGSTLERRGRASEATAVYQDLIGRFDGARTPGIERRVAQAMVRLGGALAVQGKLEEAVRAYEGVMDRFCESAHPDLQEQVASALVDLGGTLRRLGRTAEGMGVHEYVALRFGDAVHSATRGQAARALRCLGDARAEQGQLEPAAETYGELNARFGESPDPAVREQVDRGLVGQGDVLWRLGSPDRAIRAYSAVVTRFRDRHESAAEPVSRALVKLGVALGQLDRGAEAEEACRQALAWFGTSTDVAVAEQVALARFTLSLALARRGRHAEAAAVSEELVASFRAGGRICEEQLGAEAYWLHAATTMARQPEAAEGAFARWIDYLADRPAPLIGTRLDVALRFLVASFPLSTVRGWLLRLAGSRESAEVSETARLHLVVLAAVEAGRPATSRRARTGAAPAVLPELVAVPRELRATVAEVAAAIGAVRRAPGALALRRRGTLAAPGPATAAAKLASRQIARSTSGATRSNRRRSVRQPPAPERSGR